MNLRQWSRATWQALADRPPEDRFEDFTQAQVETVLRMSVGVLVEALVDDGELRLDDLGRLWVEEKPPQRKVSNLGGQRREHLVPARRVARFRASRRVAARLEKDGSVNGPPDVNAGQ